MEMTKKLARELSDIKLLLNPAANRPQETTWVDKYQAARLLHVMPRYLSDQRERLARRGIRSTTSCNKILFDRESILRYLSNNATKHTIHEPITSTDTPVTPR